MGRNNFSLAVLPAPRQEHALRIVPLILAVALFMEQMDSTVIATSLPAIAADIGAEPISLKLALTAYFVSLAIFIPLSGWIAGLWFRLLPVTDWAAYALAMATLGISLIVCWHLAREVVDRRRAFLTVLMLAIYPLFNFKGFKYNADLLQLVMLPLIVLAFLRAFKAPTVRAGLWLGLAAMRAIG